MERTGGVAAHPRDASIVNYLMHTHTHTHTHTLQVPNDNDPNWNIDKIEVLDDKPGSMPACFNYGDWLDTEKTSATISRWQTLVNYRFEKTVFTLVCLSQSC